jgi:outer membrane lipoprotein-sorting protein
MKTVLALVFAALIAAVFISGCVEQGTTITGGGGPQLTQSQQEDQAFSTVDQEMQQAIGNITLQGIENQLLQQG